MGLSTLHGAGMKSLAIRWVFASVMAVVAVLVSTTDAEAQETHLLVIVGLGGSEKYTDQFHQWATTLTETVTTRHELLAENVIYLGEKPDLAPDVIDGSSTRENIETAIESIANRASPVDHVVVVLFGHGSFTDTARINLPRHDLSAKEFAELLDKLGRQQLTFVNTASASGPFIEELSGRNRTVITATKTGAERNASVFGGHFVAAFADGDKEADQNKDSRVSMLEAFVYARARVVQGYEAEGLLVTEHATLDDNGDGQGTDDPDPLAGDGVDGILARTLFFTSNVGREAQAAFPDDPELQVLYQEQRKLEAQVDELRRLRDGVDGDQYQRELETLMISLALKSREIRELEATKGGSEEL